MTQLPIKRQAIVPRLDGIQRDLEKLRVLGGLSANEFAEEIAVKPGELHEVLRDHLDDVDQFLHAIRALLEHPERYHLAIE